MNQSIMKACIVGKSDNILQYIGAGGNWENLVQMLILK